MKKLIIRDAFYDALVLVDSYLRFYLFHTLSPLMSDAEYWDSLRFAHSACDNSFNLRSLKKQAFLSPRGHRELLMSPANRRYLEKLPEQFTVYRGMTLAEFESKDFGISWTLDPKKAHFFAFTYIRNQATDHLPKVVVRATVRKDAVIAYIGGDEKEVIVIPTKEGDLKDIKVIEVYPRFMKKSA